MHNDTGGFRLEGVEGTSHLKLGKGRTDIKLELWGDPDHGVLLIWSKLGGEYREAFTSKGDLRRLREYVRTMHNDPIPIGLYIPVKKRGSR